MKIFSKKEKIHQNSHFFCVSIAVFDLDGTLILETDHTYFDLLLFEYRILDDPNYKATKEQIEIAKNSRENGILPGMDEKTEKIISDAYKGMTLNEFYDFVRKFMKEEQPGFTGMKRGNIFYKPMAEIVEYLVKNKFNVYICSGTDRFIIRPLVEENLPYIPNSQIIGSDSSIAAKGQDNADGLSYTFKKGDEIIINGQGAAKNLQMNKVVSIIKEIGMQPVLAFGNSSTDASMVNYAISGNKHKALGFMLCSDDLEREYGNMKKAEKMYADCKKYGWICISMKNDWKTIYGENIKKR